MRQIEKQMLAAIKERRDWNSSNTTVSFTRNDYLGTCTASVLLHGNKIAEIFFGPEGTTAKFTLAGWDTNTTRSRLNALGVGVAHVKRQPVYPGGVIEDDEAWYSFEFNEK